MKTFVCLALIHLSLLTAQAQRTGTPESGNHREHVGVNLIGDLSWISVHYDVLFPLGEQLFLSGKLGFGYLPEKRILPKPEDNRPDHHWVTLPHHLTLNFGKGNHFLECGAGSTVVIGSPTSAYVFYPMLGYRYVPNNPNEPYLRLTGYYPLTGLDRLDTFFLPIGLTVGLRI